MVCEPGKVCGFLVVAADDGFSFEQLPVALSDLSLVAEQWNRRDFNAFVQVLPQAKLILSAFQRGGRHMIAAGCLFIATA